MWSRYRLVLGRSAWRFFLPAASGRLGVAMTGLGLLSVVQASTGSFTTAGAVVGCFALAEAVAGPQVARLFDRFGQRRPLVLLVLVHAAAVAALVGAAHAGGVATAPLCMLAAVAGASLPQLGACSAARWTRLFVGSPLLRTAFALEAIANDLAFLLGPTIVVAAAVYLSPVTGTVLATGLVVFGASMLAAVREARPDSDALVPSSSPKSDPGAVGGGLLRASFVSIVMLNIGLGGVFGSLQVAFTASMAAAGHPGLAGGLYSLLALGGLLGGFFFGAKEWRASPPRQLISAALCLLAAVSLIATAPTLAWLAGATLTAGLVVAPVMVLSGSLVERLVSPRVITQALSWTASASAAGLAGAAGAAGYLVDRHDSSTGFLVAAAAAATVLLGATATALTTRSTYPSRPHRHTHRRPWPAPRAGKPSKPCRGSPPAARPRNRRT